MKIATTIFRASISERWIKTFWEIDFFSNVPNLMHPLLLEYMNRLHSVGWKQDAVMTSVNSSMFSGLISTMLNDWSVISRFLNKTDNTLTKKKKTKKLTKKLTLKLKNKCFYDKRAKTFCKIFFCNTTVCTYHMLIRRSSADKYDSPSLFTLTLLMW